MSAVYSNALYNAIGSDIQIQFNGDSIVNAIPLHGLPLDAIAAAELELHLKAAIQQFNGRVRRGELTIDHMAQ